MNHMRYNTENWCSLGINEHYMGMMEMLLWVWNNVKKDIPRVKWRAIEIGAYMGESTQILASSGLFRGGIHCIDPWAGDPVWDKEEDPTMHWGVVRDEFEYNTRHFHENGFCRIMPIRGESSKTASKFDDDSIDFVYIDGDHSYESVVKDITLYLPKIRKGGIIAGHDYCDVAWPETVNAIDETIGVPDKVFMDSSWVKVVK